MRSGTAEAGIKPVFAMTDVNQINRSLNTQTGITAEFGKNAVRTMETFTDEAYRVMFKTPPQYYKITCVQEPCTYDPKAVGNPNENIKFEAITPEEMTRLSQAIKNGEMAQSNIVLAVNGILNGQEGDVGRAGQLAIQNTKTIDDNEKINKFGETKPTLILLHYPQANNFISELMVAGYEKFLAGKLDYTNYDKSYANTVKELAPYGLSSEGHSRGTLVQENVFEILGGEGWQAPADMSVRMRGAPITQNEAESSVRLIGMDPDKQLNYFALPNDPVNVIVGGEKGDTGAAWREIYELRTPTSAHSCYGSGAAGCVSIEAPFNYDSLGKTPAELNAIREQRRLGQ